MTKTITDRDMAEQVSRSLGADADDFDTDAIVEEIRKAYGLIDIDDIDSDTYWALVERHAI